MKCFACGGEKFEGARFCKHCGTSFSASALSAAESVACPECGAANKVVAAFCAACGHGLGKRLAPPLETVAFDPQVPQRSEIAPSVPLERKAPSNPPEREWGYEIQDQPPVNAGDSPPKRPSKSVLWVAGVVGIVAISLIGYILFSKYAKAPTFASDGAAVANEQKNEWTTPAAVQEVPLTSSKLTPIVPVNVPPLASPESNKKPPTVAKPRIADKQPSAPADRKAQPLAKSAQEGQPVPAEPTQPRPAPSDTSSNKSSFERELDACRAKGFLGRGVCTEQVKWKYCSVNGVWDTSKPNCER